MAGAGLVDPYLKLGRAKMHLDALDVLLKAFTGDKAYTISRYDDLEKQRHCIRFQLKDIPDDIPLTVGDAFYNLRSCLDQLVWSLAKRLGGIIDPEHTQFPIMEVNNSDSRKRFCRQTEGVPDSAKAEIKALQPYHRGNAYKAHPLWRLDTICNLDKHRRIPTHGTEIFVKFPKISRGDVWGVRPIRPGTLAIGDPLDIRVEALNDCHIASVPLAVRDKLQLDPSIPFKVTFGGSTSGITEDRDGIREIYEFVENVVLPKFVRFFP